MRDGQKEKEKERARKRKKTTTEFTFMSAKLAHWLFIFVRHFESKRIADEATASSSHVTHPLFAVRGPSSSNETYGNGF